MDKIGVTPRPVSDGLLVVFEGIDGAGKTTQLDLARDALLAQGWSVHTTRILGGTPIGEELRKAMLSPIERSNETNLYISVAIQEALIGGIGSERAAGKIILMDRGPLSLAAYEIYGGGLDEALGWKYVDSAMKRFRPELTILYGVDTKTALGRVQKKSGKPDYFENKPASYFGRVAEGYAVAAKRYPSGVVTIAAGQSIEAVHAQTMSAIQQALDKKL